MSRRGPRSGVSAALLGAAVLLAVAPLRAQEAPPPKEKPWYEAITLGVFLESTYTENFNHPDSSRNQFRVFDTVAGSIRLDVAEVVIQKKASAPGETAGRARHQRGLRLQPVDDLHPRPPCRRPLFRRPS